MRLDNDRWKEFNFTESKSATILNDLIYKTIEVLEFGSRLGKSESPDA
jgi:hypothetical protein